MNGSCVKLRVMPSRIKYVDMTITDHLLSWHLACTGMKFQLSFIIRKCKRQIPYECP